MRIPNPVKERVDIIPYLLLLLIIPMLLNSYLIGPRLLYVFFGVLFGYVLQRHKFCFTAGVRDIFLLKNTTITRAILFLVAFSTISFAIILSISSKEYNLIIQPMGIHNILGGVLFGIGMVIAGGCATGVLMRVGEGYQMQIFAFMGMLLGSVVGAYHYSLWIEPKISMRPIINLQDTLGIFNAVVLQCLFILMLYMVCLYFEGGKSFFSFQFFGKQLKFSKAKKTYFKGALYLGLINVIFLYVIETPISITFGITYFAGGILQKLGLSMGNISFFESEGTLLSDPSILFIFAIILGSFLSSYINREFRYRKVRSKKYLYMGAIGGFIMGYSARIALGCNFGGFVNAVASLSLHGWVLGFSILFGAFLGSEILLRSIK